MNAQVHTHTHNYCYIVIQDIMFCVRARINSLHGVDPSQKIDGFKDHGESRRRYLRKNRVIYVDLLSRYIYIY